MEHTTTTPEDILLLLHTFQYLTIKQLCRLLAKETTITNIREKINARLIANGLVEVEALPRQASRGSSPFVYSLTKKGQRLTGADTPDAGRKSVVALSHTLAINDVAIMCQLAGKTLPGLSLLELRHESALKRYPIRLPDKGLGREKEQASLVPDLFSHFLLYPPFTTRQQASLGTFFEIDRGTELDAYTIKEKINRYLDFILAGDLLEAHFAVSAVKICFVVTEGGVPRLKQLLTWAGQTLQHSQEDTEFFEFTATDPSSLSPGDFFLQPIWQRPFSPSPLSLIEKKQEAMPQPQG